MPSRGIHGNRPVTLVRRSTVGGDAPRVAVDVVRNGLNGGGMRRIAAEAAPTEGEDPASVCFARWRLARRSRQQPDVLRASGPLYRQKVAEPADKPGSVVGSHSSRRRVAATLKQPTRRHRGQRHCLPIWSCSRWGLPCRSVARLAVRSYRTVSPLPRIPEGTVRRSALCCTFRRLSPPRRYLAPCPVEPGLSSACLRMTRLPGRLRRGRLYGSGCANAAGTAIRFSGLNALACRGVPDLPYSLLPIPASPP